nr:carboxypeptidase regulatory-like domain-containing protein [Planctomycetota bacterium]
VVIPDGTTVRGTVRDKEGAPLAGIPVSLEGTPQVTYTDPLGRYELSGLPRGASILRAGPASPRTRPYRVQVFDGKPVEAFDMVLPRGTTLRGQVVNAAGKPEPGFRVRVSQFAGLPHVGLAFVSDAHGRFEVTHLQKGKHTFIAGEAKKTVYVGEVGEVPPFTISPERAVLRTLRGEVFAPDGRHVPFGRLHVLEGKNWRGEVHIVAGRFAISHQMLSKLGNVELIVTDALDFTGRQLDVGPTVHRIPAAAIDQDARLELTRGRAIDGTARDRSGAPAAGAVLELVMNDRSWWAQRQSYRTPTDDAGRFRFVGIPPDAEVLQVRVVHDDRYAPVQPTAVPAGASGVELTLTRAASIQGVVVERDGTPVRDARVVVWAAKGDVPYGAVAHDKTVTTDRDGRFEATGLHPDVRWWLRVRRVGQGASDYLVTLREGVLAGDAPVRLVLERAVAIHGRVELPEGRSIESFGVEAKPADANAPLSHRTTRARGGTTRFLLDELRPGRYRLTFDPGVAYKVPAPIEVDAPADDVVVKLEPALPVRGRLLNGGHRRASLWLYMEPIDKRGRKPTRGSSDTSGNFVLPNELDAKGTILAKMGTELAAVLPDVHPDDGPFEIFLKPVVTVEGALENMPKALWDARRTVVLRVGALTYQARLAKDGTFRFRGLPAGTYRVELPMEGLDGAIEGKMEYTTGTGPLRLRYVVR